MIKIAVDLLGTDNNLEEIVNGLYKASLINDEIELVAFGPKQRVEELLISYGYNKNNIKIVDAKYGIKSGDNVLIQMRTNDDASLRKAFLYLKDHDDIDCLVTCGTTSALIMGAMFFLKPIEFDGIKCNPCLAACLPNKDKYFCILDCGAVIDVKPNDLVSYARLGASFIKAYQGTLNPRIGLISNGMEDNKGNAVTKAAFPLLKMSGLNFVVNIEGNKIT